MNGLWTVRDSDWLVDEREFEFDNKDVHISLRYRPEDGEWPTFLGSIDSWKVIDADGERTRLGISGKFSITDRQMEIELSNGAVIVTVIDQTPNTIDIKILDIGSWGSHFVLRRDDPVDTTDYPWPHRSRFEIVEFGDTTWLVLDSDDEGKLLLREFVLEEPRDFNERGELDLGWHNSELRSWLNKEYLDSFDPIDRDRIRETYVNNTYVFGTAIPGLDEDRVSPEIDTSDRIFVLSAEEAVVYFTSLKEVQLDSIINHQLEMELGGQGQLLFAREDTRVARDNGELARDWWLRTPDMFDVSGFTSSSFRRFVVRPRGFVDRAGVSAYELYVRPAMWVYN